jgi:hypothetical protein
MILVLRSLAWKAGNIGTTSFMLARCRTERPYLQDADGIAVEHDVD